MNQKKTPSLWSLVLLIGVSCCFAQDHGHDHGAHSHAHGDERAIPFTIWTDTFEIFAEHPFLVVDKAAAFVTHVTELQTFAPRTEGPVTFVLVKGSERIEHEEPAPQRDGIYIPELVFPQAGSWSGVLQIPMGGQTYEVPLPPMQVYPTQEQADQAPDPTEPEGFSFLKEQQWVIPFMVKTPTSRVQNGVAYHAVPESSLAFSADAAYVYVQVGGETFSRRRVQVKDRVQGIALVGDGLAEQDHVVTFGVGSVALAHGEPADQGQGDVVHVTEEQIRRFGITCREAAPGGIEAWIQAPGEIKINHERMAHIVPRVKGVVSEVHADLGQHVQAGQVLAHIESRDLADAKADFLSTSERLEMARTQFEREERLFQQKVTSEEDYLSSKQRLAETRIAHRAARQKLLALGLTREGVDQLPTQPEEAFTTYSMLAPFDGTIIRKHIVLGEIVDDSSEVLVIADLRTIWVDLSVNQSDIEAVAVGQPTEIFYGSDSSAVRGEVSYVDSVLDAETRMATVRTELDNRQGQHRPGTFVTGRIGIRPGDQGIIVPASALQIVNDRPCVFVQTADGFALRYVTAGQKDTDQVEILSGVQVGEQIVTRNAFHLKAELTKQAVSGHGHVH
ncbi:MAG: efflux RND transporter periplasmic adaptor subunit [Phycisphaerales bacterium]|nr:MAG: efflux RND transporter periplasmic adaptor subunit [Phycisphaerales bacterium]